MPAMLINCQYIFSLTSWFNWWKNHESVSQLHLKSHVVDSTCGLKLTIRKAWSAQDLWPLKRVSSMNACSMNAILMPQRLYEYWKIFHESLVFTCILSYLKLPFLKISNNVQSRMFAVPWWNALKDKDCKTDSTISAIDFLFTDHMTI